MRRTAGLLIGCFFVLSFVSACGYDGRYRYDDDRYEYRGRYDDDRYEHRYRDDDSYERYGHGSYYRYDYDD